MIRAIVRAAACLALAAAVTACGAVTEEKSLYERISDTLTSLTSYEATATVRYYSNNSSNAYRTKQQCLATGEYRVEVLSPSEGSGNITVFDGKTIYQYNPLAGGKVSVGTTETPERSEIFLTSFIRNHLAGREVTIAVSSEYGDPELYTALDAVIPGDNPYLASERLIIDNKTLLPVELVIMDEKGEERVAVTYHEVEYNVSLEKKLFTVDG
ncbi:MAG: hypothetical protein LBK41_02540 [Clostridiales bacterium]|jgi:outer membrane lipoprotein-sorting protein|nr:hypothetical protein [Clostridiales bacterium]